MSHPIAVIGAGLSGLHAAHLLAETGHHVMLVEARPRLGGRVLSDGMSSPSLPHRVDLGPSWFWPEMNPLMRELTHSLGLPHFEQHTQGGLRFEDEGGAVRTYPDSWGHHPAAHRIRGGMGALIEAAAHRLHGRVSIHRETQLQALTLQPHAVLLTLADSRGTWQQRASHVVLAMPSRLVASTLAFDPPLAPATVAALNANPTWMAPHAKFAALYDRPFWREQGLSGMAISRRGPLGEIHDASDESGTQGALFGFFSAPATYRRQQAPGTLERLATEQLVRLFGPLAAHPRQVWLQDWAQDPLTAGPADQWASAHPDYRRTAMSSPWSGRVFLAGTEQSDGFGGLLEGALEAGQAAADAVILALNQPWPGQATGEPEEVSS